MAKGSMRTWLPAGRLRSDQRGVAAVEAAILIPLFVIPILFGAMELGRVLWIQSQLTNSAREGGYYAQLFPRNVDALGAPASGFDCSGDNNIVARAQAGLRQGGTLLGVQTNGIDVTVRNLDAASAISGCGTATVATGDRLLITVSGEVSGLLGFIPISGYDLSGTQEVRVL